MITAWFKNLSTEEDKAYFEKQLRNSRDVLDRLVELFNEDLEQFNSLETGLGAYDTPSWSHKQAHINGGRAILRKYLKLIKPDKGAVNNERHFRG